MAQPITWQNVGGPSLADASRPLALAQHSFSGAFDQLASVLQQRENLDKANWQTQKTNNTEDAFSKMAQYATPEEYQAAVKSGAIRDIMGQYGAQVDSAALRRFSDERPSALIDRTTKANAYQDSSRDRTEQPAVDDILGKIAKGDFKAARASLDAGAYRNEAALEAKLTDAQRRLVTQGQEDTRFGTSQTQANLSIESSRESLATAREQRAELKKQKEEDKQFAAAAFQYRNTVGELGLKQGVVAKELGMPTLPNGMPNYTAIEADAALSQRYNKAINDRGLNNPSDTAVFNDVMSGLVKSGKVSPEGAQRLQAKAEMFNTSPTGKLVGNDAEDYALTKAARTAARAEAEKTNSLFISGVNSVDRLAELTSQLRKEGLEKDEIRTINEEVRRQLTNDPSTPLHIPAIVNIAASARSFNPIPFTEGNGSFYRTNFTKDLKALVGTKAYRDQLDQYLKYQGTAALENRKVLLDAAGAANVSAPLRR